MDIFIFAG